MRLDVAVKGAREGDADAGVPAPGGAARRSATRTPIAFVRHPLSGVRES
jgi:hypothetical protein